MLSLLQKMPVSMVEAMSEMYFLILRHIVSTYADGHHKKEKNRKRMPVSVGENRAVRMLSLEDSNLYKQNQNLLCCHYTKGQFHQKTRQS